jgi:hypothetical protein
MEHGWCWRAGDRCGVRKDADCVRCVGGRDFNWGTDEPWTIGTRLANNCQSTGKATGGRCVPLKDADCWQACFELGRCHQQDGVCVAETDADCAASLTCVNMGNCKADSASGHCYAPTAGSCAKGAKCMKGGCLWCPKGFEDDLPSCSWERAGQCKEQVVEAPAP